MIDVSESVTVNASVEETWGLVGRPESLADWHPAIASSTVEGGIRHLTLGDGGEVEERITGEAAHSYTYEILSSPLPVSDYSSKISAEPAGDGATLTWSCSFTPEGISEDEARQLLSGLYRSGLDAAAQRLG